MDNVLCPVCGAEFLVPNAVSERSESAAEKERILQALESLEGPLTREDIIKLVMGEQSDDVTPERDNDAPSVSGV